MCREGQIRGGLLKGTPDLLLTRFLSSFFHTCPLPLAAPPLPFSEHPTRCPSRPGRGPSSAKEKQPRERTLRAAAVAILKCCHYAQRGHLAGPHMAAGKIEVGGAVVTSPRRHAARFLVRLPVAASIAPCSVARARWCLPAPLGVLFGDSAAHQARFLVLHSVAASIARARCCLPAPLELSSPSETRRHTGGQDPRRRVWSRWGRTVRVGAST